MGAKRRVFVAFSISPSLREEIFDWEKKYEKLPVRWLSPKNLHITLLPPWYETNIEKVKEGLKKIGNTVGNFEVVFERVTYGPDPRNSRLIWAEGEAPQQMAALEDQLGKALEQPLEKRPIRLHLTLARFRPEDFPRFPITKLDDAVRWRDEIGSFVLMESHLSREGADYKILGETSLV